MRVGHGYDIHPLIAGRPCVVGGLEFDCPAGPEGHSDGDVVLHALCDALLGALALGDMGEWFGTTRPEWRGAESSRFVAAILESVPGLRVVNVDVTVVGARPRMAARRQEMRDRIASLLSIPAGAVSVKASSGNGVGEAGRGEAIEATVVLLVEEPR
ncbi:MAG: 2-C-methyl-D-erythritol 2,4-cyclodiphosphate synthase [Acidobacteria bacterium]|nr:2-C-methyl-D-erythritol 2,4-cyclodiphosphate synthase [Acidobacteriota bacterium]